MSENRREVDRVQSRMRSIEDVISTLRYRCENLDQEIRNLNLESVKLYRLMQVIPAREMSGFDEIVVTINNK